MPWMEKTETSTTGPDAEGLRRGVGSGYGSEEMVSRAAIPEARCVHTCPCLSKRTENPAGPKEEEKKSKTLGDRHAIP